MILRPLLTFLATVAILPATAETTASHQQMVDALAEIAATADETNPYLSTRDITVWQRQLATPFQAGQEPMRIGTRFKLATQLLNLGLETEALANYDRALELAAPLADRIDAGTRAQLHYGRAVAYLRRAETANCCARNTPDSCLLPIRGAGIHTDKSWARKAMADFQKTIATAPRNSDLSLKAAWLLNIAAMTLGEHPQAVSEPLRISPSFLTSEITFPRFSNVAQSLEIDTFSASGGVIVEDFDNDGRLDILVSAFLPSEQVRLFRNVGEAGRLAFEDVTAAAGLTGIVGGLNMVQADYDNDSKTDVLILRGAWLGPAGKYPNSLLRNISSPGSIRFTDEAFAAGLAGDGLDLPTQSAAWADYDLDGDLDLYVGNESNAAIRCASQLFRNDGDGTFTDVATELGMENFAMTKGLSWGDIDGDRYPDLYVSNYGAPNRLYKNTGGKAFVDLAPKLGLQQPLASFPTWFWDYDNDGRLDLFVAGYSSGVVDVAKSAFGLPTTAEPMRLYRNTPEGFRDVAPALGLTQRLGTMGANFGDLDSDGRLDMYLGTGWPPYDEVTPNALFVQRGERFHDVAMVAGFAHLQKGHAVAFADLDQDGDVDVFQQMGGAVPGDRFYDALFENPGSGNDWISLRLIGTTSNRSAIGARIKITIERDGETHIIYRYVNSGGSFGANPLRQHIGLGKAAQIISAEVFWPTTGKTQKITNPKKNTHQVIRES